MVVNTPLRPNFLGGVAKRGVALRFRCFFLLSLKNPNVPVMV